VFYKYLFRMKRKMTRKIFTLIVFLFLSLEVTYLRADEPAQTKTKRIFISDIHMNGSDSFNPSNHEYCPYGWFIKNQYKLKALLTQLSNDSSVNEVVILGDLFDGWIYPADFDATTGTGTHDKIFENVVSAYENEDVIDGFKALASAGRLTYVRGNHDMFLSDKILEEAIPGINICESGIFEEDGIVAEHGNRYSLYNAPNDFDHDGHALPMGYFTSRISATSSAVTGHVITTPEIFQNLQYILTEEQSDPKASQIDGDMTATGAEDFQNLLLAEEQHSSDHPQLNSGIHIPTTGVIFDLIYCYFCIKDKHRIGRFIMSGLDNFGASTDRHAVAHTYKNSNINWPSKELHVSVLEAILCEILGKEQKLFNIAKKVYMNPDVATDNRKVVIFGHTHLYTMQKYNNRIYVNDGSWIDTVDHCTYCETVYDTVKKTETVTLYSYDEDGKGGYVSNTVNSDIVYDIPSSSASSQKEM